VFFITWVGRRPTTPPVEMTILLGNCGCRFQANLSSRPERTRISYHEELATSTYAPFRRERRMRIANANTFDRKSGGA
jgi:hypothetical protein